MKKVLLTVFILYAAVVACFFGTEFKREYAWGVDSPYVVIGEDVWLLDTEGGKIFLLPKTYYARIASMDDHYYYVVFNGVAGKIPKGSVSVVGYDSEIKETATIIHIASEYSVFTEIKLRSKLEGDSNEDVTVPTNEALTYLGNYKQGDTMWYYVSFGGKYGYLKSSYTDSPDLKFSDFVPNKTIVEAEQEEQTETPKEEKMPELTKILIIAGVSVAVIILLIIIFVPRKNKHHRYYYS